MDRPAMGALTVLCTLLAACGRIDYDTIAGAEHGPLICSGVAAGEYGDTVFSPGVGVSLANARTGEYLSPVCDGREVVRWSRLVPTPLAPYGKELPAEDETGYRAGGIAVDDLVGVWLLDGGPGAIADAALIADDSALGNDGAATGGSLSFVDGLLGAGVDFVDDPALIRVAQNDPLDRALAGDLSISVWVRTTQRVGGGLSQGVWIVEKDVPNCALDWFFLLHDGHPVFWTECDALESETDVADGQWHHLAATRRQATGEKTIYVDGAPVAMAIHGTNLLMNTDDLAFGGDEDSLGNQFAGTLDEISLWRRVLSEAEIGSLYARGALRLSYQVRSCDDPECDTEPFAGPAAGGTYSELSARGADPAWFPLSVPENRYFQYVVLFDSPSPESSPVLVDVSVHGAPP